MTVDLRDSVICITGGTGSLGASLVSLLHIRHRPRKIIVYSRGEQLQQQMQRQLSEIVPELRFFIGDVREYDRLIQAFGGVDYVVNAAAMKHIDVCEYNPLEAVKTNVLGAANVVRACLDCGVKRAVQIGTDKNVSPLNGYGATKLCAEKLFLASNVYNKTRFSATRYGNVIASRGSVIETWLNLKAQGIHEFGITHPEMTRFWITLPHAAECVLAALTGDVDILIPRIPAMKMVDVARAIDPECTLKFVGMRPGEKLHECLASPDEHIPGCEQGYYSNTAPQMTIEEFRKLAGI